MACIKKEEKMTNREKQEYELALKTGRVRFGSICEHKEKENGRCKKCLRKII
jgi:hypothetical protein